MTHFPFDFAYFSAGQPGRTSAQNGTNLQGHQGKNESLNRRTNTTKVEKVNITKAQNSNEKK
jgi:hypothetical protein